MADNLSGIEEDVQFDWTTATNLAKELRATATELDQQIGKRNQISSIDSGVRKQWRGTYAEQFDGRLKICTDDAKHFADKMREAANGLDELAKAAKQEQDRRVKAREWVEHQKHKSIWDKGVGVVKHAIGLGDDVPPVPPPVDPPKIPIGDPQSRSRGPATPASQA